MSYHVRGLNYRIASSSSIICVSPYYSLIFAPFHFQFLAWFHQNPCRSVEEQCKKFRKDKRGHSLLIKHFTPHTLFFVWRNLPHSSPSLPVKHRTTIWVQVLFKLWQWKNAGVKLLHGGGCASTTNIRPALYQKTPGMVSVALWRGKQNYCRKLTEVIEMWRQLHNAPLWRTVFFHPGICKWLKKTMTDL